MKTHHFAEYVSPGHPDRLADAIAEGIVTAATTSCPESLDDVEVAVHTNHVFVDGRVAAKVPRQKFLRQCRELVRDVFETAGYNDTWRPHPRELKFRHDLCIEQLEPDEAAIRGQADDQNIVLAHATADPRTNHLPPVHFAANASAITSPSGAPKTTPPASARTSSCCRTSPATATAGNGSASPSASSTRRKFSPKTSTACCSPN